MNILKNIYTKHKLLIIILVLISIYGLTNAKYIKDYTTDYINKNFYRLKNNPIAIPLQSVNNKKGNLITNSVKGLVEFLTKLFKSFIGLFLKPFYFFFNIIKKTLFTIKNTLDKFRIMAKTMRELFQKTVENTANRLDNSYSAMLYLQEKIKLLIKKQSAVFTLFNQFAISLKFVLASFTEGPIPRIAKFLKTYAILMFSFIGFCLACLVGGPFTKLIACPVCALCFDKDTRVQISETQSKLIKDINLLDKIYKGGKVIGLIKVRPPPYMYDYNGVIVSGSHLVFDKNIWKRVDDTDAIKIKYDVNKDIYCLITENNKIVSGNHLFSDYSETNNQTIIRKINSLTINSLNMTENYYQNDKSHIYNWGFTGDTEILINGIRKKIINIRQGDYLKESFVIGLIVLDGSDKILYKYKGLKVCGTQLVYENKKWIRVFESTQSKKLKETQPFIYHVITNNNKLWIDEILFTDFCQTHDKTINDNIDKILLESNNLYKI
uniref:Hedgehog/Intein (Hint) domain-containing protein n=1 Tax=viral metagenome TaxID=1070528 RepID=A0A6C0IXR9_9ZZZZ